tara:strand:- start:3122 stop:3631 length:510 start_codon:yes stop_codon:yes gene_type:complete
MVKYESLLLGGKVKKSKKVESSSSESESEEEEKMMGEGKKKKGGMTYAERCANLAKGRATRMANLAKKKKMGKGQYNQDYVDESQVNYMGSPLDIYYQVPKKEALEQKRERGENVGKGVKKSKGIAKDMIEMGETGGKVKKEAEHQLDINGAIENLAMLAKKFGLRLIK